MRKPSEEKVIGKLGNVIDVTILNLNPSIKQSEEVWEKLFPLRSGQKVKLLVSTSFLESSGKSFTLPAGTKGRIVNYTQGSPFITVIFRKKKKVHLCLLDVRRVKRI